MAEYQAWMEETIEKIEKKRLGSVKNPGIRFPIPLSMEFTMTRVMAQIMGQMMESTGGAMASGAG